VLADPAQLELMFLNLVANARDAMPDGGALVIETRRTSLDAQEAARLGSVAGPHVLICISDEGLGMDAATRERIFEPFFTTKEPGRGTGLGLPTVFGIVKQCRGIVSVESKPGHGARFSVSLPVTDEPLVQEAPALSERTVADTRTILVVEDEPDVRRIVVHLLRRAGYQVIDASTPEAALSLVRERPRKFDLLLTDVLMPAMSGRQLANGVRAALPGIAVLYMSGYPDTAFDADQAPAEGDGFLPKPFTPDTLLAAVTRALASRSGPKEA
jgi:CheY-like chemotaxis protein